MLDSRFSEVTGLPSILLMEQAASGISEFIVDLVQAYDTGTDYDVVFFTGAGNDGGDGWASARQLMASGCRVAVYDLYPDRELLPDAEINRAAYKRLGAGRAALLRLLSAEMLLVFGCGLLLAWLLSSVGLALFARFGDLVQVGGIGLADVSVGAASLGFGGALAAAPIAGGPHNDGRHPFI